MTIDHIATLMRHEAIAYNAMLLARRDLDRPGEIEYRKQLKATRRKLRKALREQRAQFGQECGA